jgi:hypothetical protein
MEVAGGPLDHRGLYFLGSHMGHCPICDELYEKVGAISAYTILLDWAASIEEYGLVWYYSRQINDAKDAIMTLSGRSYEDWRAHLGV